MTIEPHRGYLRRRGPQTPCDILSVPFGRPAGERRPSLTGDLMPEILTESFCERCGTRYTFEAQVPRKSSLGKLRLLSKGVKNYVLSDETTLEEAFADARSDEEREITGQQLDAFHKTFNFCMTCRQYTCGNCWNDVENRCLTCAPHVGHEIMPAAFPNLQARLGMAQIETAAAGDGNGHVDAPVIDPAAWPSIDLHGPASAAETVVEEESRDEASQTDLDAAAARLASMFGEPAATAEPAVDLETEAEPEADVEVATAAPEDLVEPVEAVSAPELVAEPVEATEPTATLGETPGTVAEPAEAEFEAVAEFEAAAELDGVAEAEAISEPTLTEPEVIEAEHAATFEDIEERWVAVELLAEPDVDVLAEPIEAAAGIEAAAEPATDEIVESEAVSGPEAIAEPEAVAEPEIAAEAQAVAEPEATAAPEAIAEPEVAAEPEAAIEPKLEAAPDAEQEAAAARAAAAAAQTAEILDKFRPATPPPAAPPIPLRPAVDLVIQPGWQVTAPEAPAAIPDGGGAQPLQAAASAAAAPEVGQPGVSEAPQWPLKPEWPSHLPAREGLRQPQADWATAAQAQWPAVDARSGQIPHRGDAMWAASSRDVLDTRPELGVQACVSCGLPLSATARFCRRCGTHQG